MKEMLKKIGMEITVDSEMVLGREAFEAELETKGGKLHILCYDGCKPTARVDKPNGTHKWLYEKTPAQLRRAVVQTIEFYGRA